MMNESEAIRCYRQALLIGLIAPLVEYFRFILFSSSIFYDGIVLVFAVTFAVFIPVLWFMGFLVIMFVSAAFHFVFGGTTTCSEWQQATFRGLWPLPYACALGVITWLIYSLGDFGGWPSDVMFGAFANLVGAWVYLTLFRRWFIVRRFKSHHYLAPGNA